MSGIATPVPTPGELQGLLGKAIHLLDAELNTLTDGPRTDLLKVLAELRYQVAALTSLIKAHRASDLFEKKVLAAIKGTDEKVWLTIANALEKDPEATLPPLDDLSDDDPLIEIALEEEA